MRYLSLLLARYLLLPPLPPDVCRYGVLQEVQWVSDVSSIKDNSWLADSFSSLLGPTSEVGKTHCLLDEFMLL